VTHNALTRSPARKTEGGFTLTEALIAITILAGIAAAMAPALQGSFKVAHRIHTSADKAEETRILSSVLRQALDGIVQAPNNKGEPLFKGTSQQFHAVSYGFNSGKPHPISVSTKRSGESRMDLFIAYGDEAQNVPVRLLQAPQIRFSYFGSLKKTQTPQWHQRWQSKTLPQLIRLTASSKTNEDVSELQLDFLIQAQAPLMCRFDAVSRQCRDG